MREAFSQKFLPVLGVLCAFCFCAALVTACAERRPAARNGAGGAPDRASITIKGSDTMVKLSQRWAEVYRQTNPDAMIQVTGGGSGTGLAALLNGATDIAQSSRPMKPEERADFRGKFGRDVVEVKVALDAVAAYVHHQNPITEISVPEMRDVYTGRVTDWKELGGAPGRIILYSRENNSGTYEYFKEHVMAKADFAAQTQTLSGTSAVINAVSKDRLGIGYGGIGYAAGVKILPVKKGASSPAVAPTAENVENGTYPISRDLYFYLPAAPQGEVKKFIDWALGPAGQEIVKEEKYFPVRD
jgi:phosphate transport system substrate-binding protein